MNGKRDVREPLARRPRLRVVRARPAARRGHGRHALGLGGGPMREEEPHHLKMSTPSRHQQRREAARVLELQQGMLARRVQQQATLPVEDAFLCVRTTKLICTKKTYLHDAQHVLQ